VALTHSRTHSLTHHLTTLTLKEENNQLKFLNEEYKSKVSECVSELQALHQQVDEYRTSTRVSECDSGNNTDHTRINYFATAISEQRDNYNSLKHSYDHLRDEYNTLSLTHSLTLEENRLLRNEVSELNELLTTHSTQAESVLTSSFLQHYRERECVSECVSEDVSEDVSENTSVDHTTTTTATTTLDHTQVDTTLCCSSETLVEELTINTPYELLCHLLLNMNGRTFERLCCYLFECIGYRTVHRGGSCDLGIDFELLDKDYSKTWKGVGQCVSRVVSGVGQCKRYNRKIGSQDIRAFTGSMLSNGCHTGYFMTTSVFTRDAVVARDKSFEKNIHIELWDYECICEKILTGGYARVLLERLDALSDDPYTSSGPTTTSSSSSGGSSSGVLQSNMWTMRSPVASTSLRKYGHVVHVCSSDDEDDSSDSSRVELQFDTTIDEKENDSDFNQSRTHSHTHSHAINELTDAVSSMCMTPVVKQEPPSTPHSSHSHAHAHSHMYHSTPSSVHCTPQHTKARPCVGSPTGRSNVSAALSPRTHTPSSHYTTRARGHDRWDDNESEALATLVCSGRFTGSNGSIQWGKMSQWLCDNEASRVASVTGSATVQWEPCALNPVHFKKDKLRCRWKNYDSKKYNSSTNSNDDICL
jgi:hypothetical protein